MDIQKIIHKKLNNSSKKDKPTSKNKVSDLFGSSSSDTSNIKIKKYSESDLNLNIVGNKIEDSAIITLVNDMFLNALRLKASDIHIEPRDDSIRIRFRVDWNFINYKDIDIKKKNSIVARIKIMSYLRIDEHRLPQDWKINYKLFAWKTVDMRISFIPTIYGEKCVVRY